MKLLLDTHVWVWTLEHPVRLSRGVRRQLEDLRNERYLSPVSVWEARLLENRGRLRLARGFSRWLADAFAALPVVEAPINFAVGEEAAGIHLPQSDIGDVFLAATARVYDLTLVTADTQLLACSWLRTLPAY